jgi:hypothetical protein
MQGTADDTAIIHTGEPGRPFGSTTAQAASLNYSNSLMPIMGRLPNSIWLNALIDSDV